MNSLFPEEKVKISFNCSYIENISGNKKEYYVGIEEGILRKSVNAILHGYEFVSDNGCRYFITTIKKQIPEGYDAVFTLADEHLKITIEILSKCKKGCVHKATFDQ